MLRKSLLLLALLVSAHSICADELPDECEAAVDAADRLNSDSNKHCDYSKTGLNGVLHKAFANKEAVDSSATHKVSRALTREFDSAQQLGAARYELLQLAAKECPAGFVLVDERYLPAREPRLKLELNYHCL